MAVRKQFVFDGKSSIDLGCYTTGTSTYNSSSVSQSKTSVPGRNGDLILLNDRFENDSYEVKIGILGLGENAFHLKARELRSFLLSRKGYCRYEDDYHPDEYRMAQFVGPITFDENLLIAGEATLTFDCKPQHFLKCGEETITFVKNGMVENPTYFESRPLIRVYGSGTLNVANGIFTVKPHNHDYVDIDCETWSAFNDVENLNGYVTVSNNGKQHVFPGLNPGENVIELGSGITKVELTPRWFMM